MLSQKYNIRLLEVQEHKVAYKINERDHDFSSLGQWYCLELRQKFPNNKEVRMITLLIMVNLYSLPYEIII